MSILTEAEELINGDRAASYGSPLKQYEQLAGMLNAYLGTDMTYLDAINIMLLIKVNRVRSEMGWHRDSYADIAGYAGVAEKAHREAHPDPEPVPARGQRVPLSGGLGWDNVLMSHE